jgi:hypothetical protein
MLEARTLPAFRACLAASRNRAILIASYQGSYAPSSPDMVPQKRR